MILVPRIWVMSIAAMALTLGLGAAPAAAQTGDSAPGLTVTEMLAAALAGDEAAHSALQSMFTKQDGRGVEEIADLAVELINALEGDPIEVADAADLIAELATESLNAVPLVHVSIDEQFVLPEGAFGWDFGPPDAAVYEGFEKVTPRDVVVDQGDDALDIRRPGGEGLLSDGIRNVQKFKVEVPDGVYRLIVLTDDLGDRNRLKHPLGRSVIINGKRQPLSATRPEEWLEAGGLRGIRSRLERVAGQGTLDSPGAYVIIVKVVKGVLEIEFVPDEVGDIFLTGLILEPVDDDLAEEREFEFALRKIEEAQGEVFANLETTVGDPRDVSPS